MESKTPYNKLDLEYQNYESDIVTILKDNGILVRSLIDEKDKTQIAWATEETISINEYLKYCISMNWIDVTKLDLESQYSDSEEIYARICEYLLGKIDTIIKICRKEQPYAGKIAGGGKPLRGTVRKVRTAGFL